MALHFLPIYNCFYWSMSSSGNQQPIEALVNVENQKSEASFFQILDMVFCIYFSIDSNKSAIYLAGFIGWTRLFCIVRFPWFPWYIIGLVHTGYSFWDQLHNFLHKFTWIVLSVHKLNKLGKFWYIYGQLLNIMSSYGWYKKVYNDLIIVNLHFICDFKRS